MTLTIMGCQSPLIPSRHEIIDVASLCAQPPCHTSTYFQVRHVPNHYPVSEITDQADQTMHAIFQWLAFDSNVPPVCLLVFSPNEPPGQAWLQQHQGKHHAAGGWLPEKNALVIAGSPDDPRFWTVLRHEAAHYALHCMVNPGQAIPFWLAEGVACLYETGVDQDNHPLPNPERLKLLRYLAQTRYSLYLEKLINQQQPSRPNGQHYAKAWGIAAYLFHTKQSPAQYLQALHSAPDQPEKVFKNTLLAPNEEIKDFEKAIRNWIGEKPQQKNNMVIEINSPSILISISFPILTLRIRHRITTEK